MRPVSMVVTFPAGSAAQSALSELIEFHSIEKYVSIRVLLPINKPVFAHRFYLADTGAGGNVLRTAAVLFEQIEERPFLLGRRALEAGSRYLEVAAWLTFPEILSLLSGNASCRELLGIQFLRLSHRKIDRIACP